MIPFTVNPRTGKASVTESRSGAARGRGWGWDWLQSGTNREGTPQGDRKFLFLDVGGGFIRNTSTWANLQIYQKALSWTIQMSTLSCTIDVNKTDLKSQKLKERKEKKEERINRKMERRKKGRRKERKKSMAAKLVWRYTSSHMAEWTRKLKSVCQGNYVTKLAVAGVGFS